MDNSKFEDSYKPVYFKAKRKSYSLTEILKEIRHQSDIEKPFAKKLNNLTIDVLFIIYGIYKVAAYRDLTEKLVKGLHDPI